MSFYDGTGNDMNIAGFKTSNIALKNTPQQNPKEFKTKTEKQAKENDGKTSSIINLLDEIDTTTRIFLRLFTPSRSLSLLSPACSPPSRCFFARDYSHAGGPVRCAR